MIRFIATVDKARINCRSVEQFMSHKLKDSPIPLLTVSCEKLKFVCVPLGSNK